MKGGRVSQWKAAAGLVACVLVFVSAERPVFTNHFLVELHKGGDEEARQVAAEHGFGVRKVRFLPCISRLLFKTGAALAQSHCRFGGQVFSFSNAMQLFYPGLFNTTLPRVIFPPSYVIKMSFKLYH